MQYATFNALILSAFHADNPVVFFDITAGDGRHTEWMRHANHCLALHPTHANF